MSDEQKKEATTEAPKEKEEAVVEKSKENETATEQKVEKKESLEENSKEKDSSPKPETSDTKTTTSTNNKEEEKVEEKKNKKINVMSLKEIEQAIDKTKKNQGGLYSRYAHELIKRKDYLTKNIKK